MIVFTASRKMLCEKYIRIIKYKVLMDFFFITMVTFCWLSVSPEGMKMRGMKNEANGTAKANKVVSHGI